MQTAALSSTLSQILSIAGTPIHKLQQLHLLLQQRHPVIHRISVALYDAETDLVKTFLHSPAGDDALPQHQALLASSQALLTIACERCPRVINQMTDHHSNATHTRTLIKHGFQASYTLPIFHDEKLLGFIFFDSRQAEVMTPLLLEDLDLYGHLIGMMVANELQNMNTLRGVVRAMGNITRFRDVETASHLQRMSRFARLIARQLVQHHDLTDEFVEYVFLFSPLHDIGKIAVPDDVLLKPDRLTEAEFDIMRDHTVRGREMIDQVLLDMDLHDMPHVDLLRDIIAYHHERWDGKGYPHGLAGEAIPLAARIVAVADVFDALVSARPYKPAWSNEAAIEHLQLYAGSAFDKDCVKALTDNLREVVRIQRHFGCDSSY